MAVSDFDDMYAALRPRLVRTAYAVAGDLGVAEDTVQTAFAKAYRSWRRISRLEAPEAYLRRMAVNEVLNDRRLARRRHEITSAEPPERAGAVGLDPLTHNPIAAVAPASTEAVTSRARSDPAAKTDSTYAGSAASSA